MRIESSVRRYDRPTGEADRTIKQHGDSCEDEYLAYHSKNLQKSRVHLRGRAFGSNEI
jgi:hypothetical protein